MEGGEEDTEIGDEAEPELSVELQKLEEHNELQEGKCSPPEPAGSGGLGLVLQGDAQNDRDTRNAREFDESSVSQEPAGHGLDHAAARLQTRRRVADNPKLKCLLMKACQLGHRTAVEKLLAIGVSDLGVHKGEDEFKGITPLLVAIKVCCVEIIHLLVDHNTTKALEGKPSPLFLAVEEYVNEEMKQDQESVNNDKKRGTTRLEVVKMLLLHPNIKLNVSFKNGMTAIHMLCINNHVEVLKLFLTTFSRNSTNVTWSQVFNSTNSDGWTPFMCAVKKGHIEVVKKLLEVCPTDLRKELCVKCHKNHMNAVMVAVQHGQLDSLKIMDEYITDNAVYTTANKTGLTALHYVCCAGKPGTNSDTAIKVLKWLLTDKDICGTNGAINAKNKKGYNPLLVACQYQKHSLVTELLSAGADHKVITEDGLSGLHIAAMHDSKESAIIAQALLDAGLDPKLQESKYGDTAYHTCCKQANINVEDVLMKHAQFEALKAITNKDGKIADDTRTTVVIPAAIKRRGPSYVEQYWKALKEGKTTIRRLQLLVLGEERVGKTSLVRSMLGMEFLPDCKSTQGIDMTSIGPEELIEHVNLAVDEESEGTDVPWVTINPSKCYELAVAKNLPAHSRKDEKRTVDSVQLPATSKMSEQEVLRQIERIEREISEQVLRENAPLRRSDLLMMKTKTSGQHVRSSSRPHTTDRHQDRFPGFSLPAAHSKTSSNPASTKPATSPTLKTTTAASAISGTNVTAKASTTTTTSTAAAAATSRPSHSPPSPTASSQSSYSPPPPTHERSISQGSARQIERLSRSGKGKDPPLTFHTLDFAGQKLYRPMHHCFITRRAMYIVVFNLQVLVKDLNEKHEDSLQKIRYWLNNVYAHSQTARGESMSENKPKIFLVGTHCSPDKGNKLTKQELKTVHSALKAEFLDKECDDRFLDCIVHQCDEKKRSVRCFFPVENSLTEKMRDQSGMIVLQEHIKKHAGKLPFLNEVSPVSWLKFEEVLLKEREDRKKTPLSTTRADVKKWAEQCGVPDFMTALIFFHDTGLVIDQGLLPDNSKLSSTNTNDGHDSIVVLLDPQWLAMIMAAIIELRTGNEDYDQKALKQLEKTGTVRPDILRQCWKDLLHNNDSMFDKICQILKIYYLLCPINKPPTKYLIPTMLPAGKVDFNKKYNMKFYFEFPLYLPEEVYTHLVCVFLERPHKSHKLTATSFSVCSVHGINWKVSLKADKQRLKVKASFPRTSCDNRTPFVVIKLFHEQFLSVVCLGDMLGSLAYNGGPLAECEECSFNGVVPCVAQPENGESESVVVDCPSEFCSNKFNVNELMRNVEHNQQTKPTVPHVESDASPPRPVQQVNYETKYFNFVESGASANFSQITPAGDHSISSTSSTPAVGATPPTQQYHAPIQNSTPQAHEEIATGGQIRGVCESDKQTLTISDLRDVLKQLSNLTPSNYSMLGLELGLLEPTVSRLESTHSSEDLGRHIMKAWLNQVDNVKCPTWECLIAALQSPIVKQNAIAQQLKQWLTSR